MDISLKEQEIEARNKKRARILSAIIHALLLIVLLVMVKYTPIPDPQTNEGIAIAFGQVDAGGGYDEPVEAEESQEYEEVEEAAESEVTPDPTPTPDAKTANSDEVAIKKKKEADRKKAEDARKKAEAKKKAEAEAEARRKAAEAAAKKKALEDKLKGSGKTSGGGGGNTGGTAGDPNVSNTGGGTGGGTTGSGADVSGRTVAKKPSPPTNPGVKGSVVVKICIDNKGNVTSAEFTQRGSTVTDGGAIAEAVANAKKWKFNTDVMAPDKQCGTVRYNYTIK
jgi:outer membrane biosynthesis protein TonB